VSDSMPENVAPVGGFVRFQLRPQPLSQGKTVKRLATTELLAVSVQVVASGGETNRHAHVGEDAMWFVVAGRARFYGATDTEVVELDKHDGLVIRSGDPYWFESASDDSLVILRVGGLAQNEQRGRIDYSERKARAGAVADGA
jgi:mannose-6-phosphate isomerase-like protein (cupin superfamily)